MSLDWSKWAECSQEMLGSFDWVFWKLLHSDDQGMYSNRGR